jgi:hypothetical protein
MPADARPQDRENGGVADCIPPTPHLPRQALCPRDALLPEEYVEDIFETRTTQMLADRLPL